MSYSSYRRIVAYINNYIYTSKVVIKKNIILSQNEDFYASEEIKYPH